MSQNLLASTELGGKSAILNPHHALQTGAKGQIGGKPMKGVATAESGRIGDPPHLKIGGTEALGGTMKKSL